MSQRHPKKISQDHKSARRGVGDYVRDDVNTNNLKLFWAIFKRGYYGTFNYMSNKYLQRYVDEFQGRNNIPLDARKFMKLSFAGFEGKSLTHRQLVDRVDT